MGTRKWKKADDKNPVELFLTATQSCLNKTNQVRKSRGSGRWWGWRRKAARRTAIFYQNHDGSTFLVIYFPFFNIVAPSRHSDRCDVRVALVVAQEAHLRAHHIMMSESLPKGSHAALFVWTTLQLSKEQRIRRRAYKVKARTQSSHRTQHVPLV